MTEALDLQPGLSDGDLVRSAADGDRQAFAELYDRYADRLYDFCIGLIGDRDAAADCVQDTFCVAATDLGSLREPDKLRPWLYSIARHHALRRLRHRYREEASDELPDMVSHDASPETLAGQSELARLVAEAAGGLSDRDRELLDLSYRHGLDGPELAETLGVTLNSANTMMFRLRQTVERCLGALLVARGVRANPDACPELAASLKGWDGQFSVLMRKRLARHIDSCPTCEQDQRRHVNPVALLGSTAVFIPAPLASSSDVGPRAADVRELRNRGGVRPCRWGAADSAAADGAGRRCPAGLPGIVDHLVRGFGRSGCPSGRHRRRFQCETGFGAPGRQEPPGNGPAGGGPRGWSRSTVGAGPAGRADADAGTPVRRCCPRSRTGRRYSRPGTGQRASGCQPGCRSRRASDRRRADPGFRPESDRPRP